MLQTPELRSEITRLLAKIRQQHEAAQKGFAEPTHDPCGLAGIIQYIETMHDLRRQLQELVGDTATTMIAKELETVSPISSLALSDLLDKHYSPDLLLESHLNASITGDADFPDACEWGFIAFLDAAESGDYNLLTEYEVRAHVRREIREFHPCAGHVPLAWYVGFVLGWLSALAFVQRAEALAGLSELLSLVGQLE